MINKKNKRKLAFQGADYYWYIKKNDEDSPQIHIMSADKKIQLIYGYDKEICISAYYIRKLLQKYFDTLLTLER